MSSEIEPSAQNTPWEYETTGNQPLPVDPRHGLHVVAIEMPPTDASTEVSQEANPTWDVEVFRSLAPELTTHDLTVLEWLAEANGEPTSPWQIRKFMRTKHPKLTDAAAGQVIRQSIRNVNQSPTLPVEIRHEGHAARSQYWLADKPERHTIDATSLLCPEVNGDSDSRLNYVQTETGMRFFVDGKELQLSPTAETVAALILETPDHEVEYAELRRTLQNRRNRVFSITAFQLILKDLERGLGAADVFFNEIRFVPERGQYRFIGLHANEIAQTSSKPAAITETNAREITQQPAKPVRAPGSPRVRRVHKSNAFKDMDRMEYDRHVGRTVLRILNDNIGSPMSASLVHTTLLDSENPLDKLKITDVKKFFAELETNDAFADSFEVTGQKRLTFTLTEPINPEEAVPVRYELSERANALMALMKRFPQGVALRGLYDAYNQNLQRPADKEEFKEYIREIQLVTKGRLRTTTVGRDTPHPTTYVRMFSEAEMMELRQRQSGAR